MSKKPFVLLSNDDGIQADGLQHLCDGVREFAEVMVVAPVHERSGASHSISLKAEMALQEWGEARFAFDGSPVDCVQFAMRNLVPKKPDLMISGINHGANLANDTLYSGTVGAAMVACSSGVPALAVSLVDYHPRRENYFSTAVAQVQRLLKRGLWFDDFQGRVLNLNVPNIPSEECRGLKVAQLGERIYSQEFRPGDIPNTYRYHHEEPINFGGTDMDVTEIQNGYATLTVLRPSLYDHVGTETLKSMLNHQQD
jgi:5'-nucleotidase